MPDDYAMSPHIYMDLGVVVQLPVAIKVLSPDQVGHVVDLSYLFRDDFCVED